MQFSTLVLAALTSLASAQRTTVITVANNGSLTYSPNNIRVNVGEFVQFQFRAGNHTVTQSTFDAPCQPISMHSNLTGFHSGFQPAAASAAMGMIPTYTIQINNTNPLWLYCAQGRHCENGMVMVINEPAANASRTLASYKALAAQANTVVPNGGAAPGGGNGGGTAGTTPDAAPGAGTTPTSGVSMLAGPSTFMLIAAAGAALLL
ncbi:Cupredoxin [Lasiosphaeris hirsuta]|uniref:Cupredoxin n=1 Tax=Lasiosphaeris hirsuta TaxID=260670 RepID=A0AA39ZXP4_9PEZI|nr:Cupredoxin [Lasiosphaeris hirsuta]